MVKVLETVVPIHHNLRSGDLQAAFDNQVYNRGKVFLRCRQMSRIYIISLESSKLQFTGCNIVRMWTLHHHWDA
jgi:hypothetical protein